MWQQQEDQQRQKKTREGQEEKQTHKYSEGQRKMTKERNIKTKNTFSILLVGDTLQQEVKEWHLEHCKE